jgi:hypothetical protein
MRGSPSGRNRRQLMLGGLLLFLLLLVAGILAFLAMVPAIPTGPDARQVVVTRGVTEAALVATPTTTAAIATPLPTASEPPTASVLRPSMGAVRLQSGWRWARVRT